MEDASWFIGMGGTTDHPGILTMSGEPMTYEQALAKCQELNSMTYEHECDPPVEPLYFPYQM